MTLTDQRTLQERLNEVRGRMGNNTPAPARRYSPENTFKAVDPDDWQREQERQRRELAEQAERDRQAFLTGDEPAPYIPACVKDVEPPPSLAAELFVHVPTTVDNVHSRIETKPESIGDSITNLPPISVLKKGKRQAADETTLKRQARIIETTLGGFNVPVRVLSYRTGATVTQFAVEPLLVGKKKVKVSAISALERDLQLALGARSIRIEAPVPGKEYVGIEIPNEQAATVYLRDVMESPQFGDLDVPLALALGQRVDGTAVTADLAAMPHLLIAGTTGSGKSVCLNALIAGLLMSNTPDTLQFVMVDPKRVELVQYNGIPHLVAPVATSAQEGFKMLKWAEQAMDARYERLSAAACRNIALYNARADVEPLPYIVVVIDELADLMLLSGDEVETTLARLAALARAVGIHLVVATQRPSADVVTGLIKSNFSTRIAFAVAGINDSRTILDHAGAEQLLGSGDMLFVTRQSPAPVRVQGVYVSDDEITAIADFWRASGAPSNVSAKLPESSDSSTAKQQDQPIFSEVQTPELLPELSKSKHHQTAGITADPPPKRRPALRAYVYPRQRAIAAAPAPTSSKRAQLQAVAAPFLDQALDDVVDELAKRAKKRYTAEQHKAIKEWARGQLFGNSERESHADQ